MNESLFSGTYSIQKLLGIWSYHYLIGKEEKSPRAQIDLQIEKKPTSWEIRLSSVQNSSLNGFWKIRHTYRDFFKAKLFGHLAEVFWTIRGRYGFYAQVTIETLGTFDIKGDFSQGGMSLFILNKDSGRSLREFWTRQTTEDGLYSLSTPNAQYPTEDEINSFQVAKFENCVTMSGTAFEMTTFRLGEDFEFHLNGAMKIVNVKQFGPSRYLIVLKGNPEEQEEWIASFYGTGLILDGRHLKQSFDGRFLWIKRPKFVGTFNLVGITGISKYGTFCRFPPTFISKMKNQSGSKWTINTKNGMIQFESTSNLVPFSHPFILGTEFLANVPGFKDALKVNGHLYGDLMTFTMANSQISLLMTIKFTSNFAVVTNQIQGTNIFYKLLFEKIMNIF